MLHAICCLWCKTRILIETSLWLFSLRCSNCYFSISLQRKPHPAERKCFARLKSGQRNLIRFRLQRAMANVVRYHACFTLCVVRDLCFSLCLSLISVAGALLQIKAHCVSLHTLMWLQIDRLPWLAVNWLFSRHAPKCFSHGPSVKAKLLLLLAQTRLQRKWKGKWSLANN